MGLVEERMESYSSMWHCVVAIVKIRYTRMSLNNKNKHEEAQKKLNVRVFAFKIVTFLKNN